MKDGSREAAMCRSIKTLFNFAPPATDAEIAAAALQFVRKLSGYNAPSAANAEVFHAAVAEITKAARTLVDSLETSTQPRDRAQELVKAKQRNLVRFGPRAKRA
jgi:hypothetical protein